jgi:hypothetical protein
MRRCGGEQSRERHRNQAIANVHVLVPPRGARAVLRSPCSPDGSHEAWCARRIAAQAAHPVLQATPSGNAVIMAADGLPEIGREITNV